MTAAKAAVAIVVSALGAIVVALGTGNNGTFGSVDAKHWGIAALTILGSGGVVYACENGPWHTYIKAVVGFLSGGVASLVVALNDGHISQAEWLVAATAAITAGSAVFQIANHVKARRRTV